VAGPKFGPAAGVLRIQAFTLLLVFGYTSWGFALLGLRRHREILLSTTVALAVNAAGVAILGSSHGARGAALATVIADVVAFLAYGWQLSRAGVPVRSALSSVPRVAVAAAPAAALWFTPFPDVAKAVLATLIYGAMVLLVRAIPDELLVEARKIGRSLTAR
jgi:O-antigen/teichoic acid export membrane protein